MANMGVHKRYVLMLLALAIISLSIIFGLNFEPVDQQKIEKYNPIGTTHYDLPYSTLPPSPYLLELSFLGSIKNFNRRDTVVLIGNSVIAGAGAKNTIFLNSSLNESFNVINAGLGGEFLGASSALAVIGVDVNAKLNPSAVHHIFIAYPPSRFYVANTYWITGNALSVIAKERNLGSYLNQYREKEGEYNEFSRKLTWASGVIGANMRCIDFKNTITHLALNFEFFCEKPFRTEMVNPNFLKNYGHPYGYNFTKRELEHLSAEMNNATWITSESKRIEMENTIVTSMKPMEAYLNEKKIKHKIYFLLLRDAPAAVETFEPKQQFDYNLGRGAFIQELSRLKPGWIILEPPKMQNDAFFDTAHLRENGQEAISFFIKHVIH